MGAISVCAFSLLSALLLLHYCLLAPSAVMVSKERIQSRKLLQTVLVSSDSEKARREVFRQRLRRQTRFLPAPPRRLIT
ncbi:unnamed protein product [Miscanthus lutarioriparius]|uniref:Secreted protein n=1 Tax=Miscanthus lutarioriparius TaxID=422564 RepID=A0A811NR03_9POAL|nr:unnamed protein product [Miscanthus lutarioriparius]